MGLNASHPPPVVTGHSHAGNNVPLLNIATVDNWLSPTTLISPAAIVEPILTILDVGNDLIPATNVPPIQHVTS